MVFKPFSHLARHNLTKSLTHGYAQSVVAATQSSHPLSTTSQFGPFGNHSSTRFGKPSSLQFRDAYQNASSNANAKASSATSSTDTSNDAGLDAYYAAWQKQQRADEVVEWQQFQFAKRIGWKAPSAIFDGKSKEREDRGTQPEVGVSNGRRVPERAYTTSTAENITRAESEATAIAKVNEAIAKEIVDIQEQPKLGLPESAHTEATVEHTHNAVDQPSESSSVTARSSSPVISTVSDQTAVASPLSSDSTPHVNHLVHLQKTNRHAEIPPVFESMLRAGVLPSARAYNALLTAAIFLPTDQHMVVPKVLDIYSDMLRRKVLPNTDTYTILLDLLSVRASDVSQMKDNLKVDKLRFGGIKDTDGFMFLSQEAEHDILTEDDTLNIAIKLFETSTAVHHLRAYSASTYHRLLNACAAYGEVDHMIRIYSHMEAHEVVPFASVYPPMIKAFAASGDLRSAVECYNEYKSLAVADDSGNLTIIEREDDEVYAAVVKAYTVCGKHEGADRFFDKITRSLAEANVANSRLFAVRDTVVLNALIQARIESKDFAGAIAITEDQDISKKSRAQAMARICAAAADHDKNEAASRAYQVISPSQDGSSTPTIAMLAMHIRQGDVESARTIWTTLSGASTPTTSFIVPTAMYAVALVGSGNVDEGLMQARQSFARIRSASDISIPQSEMTEQIDEAFEFIGSFLARNGIISTPQASMSFMWAMVENGGLVPVVAEQLLAGLGPADVSTLSWQDLKLALQVEAGIVANEQATLDIAHSARFTHLLETSLSSRMPLDKRTSELVERSLRKLGLQRPDLVGHWQASRLAAAQPTPLVQASPAVVHPPIYNETYDPYAAMVDHRGSAMITEELERQGTKGGASLNEALMRFRNIRRAGRHPRYIAYSKLISAAAKDGRANLTYDILGMARQDMPFLPQYPVVRHGWASILDAMVGACLTVGNRHMAENFHQELLDIGVAPTANTFGLYITTLKESTKTFDEATEAVKIFHRAKSEGVEPSSFLYNALIGKLGKARRIDDCLLYFAEMRHRGIRPTSVTYGTIVNALCRVSDERFAQELFDEMESMPNYKPRPAPYNSLMQFFLTTKRDSDKVLEYYHRMQSRNIQPTMHTYKLLIDTYATLEPLNMAAAEGVLETIRATGQRPEAIHYASLIHAKGCALHDIAGARQIFDSVVADKTIRPQACLYQALFESMVANHCVRDTVDVLAQMAATGVEMTPYIANTLIHGWAMEKEITRAKSVYDIIGKEKREPSTYEAMTRAFLAVKDRENASSVVHEMLSRGYPSAVSGKILELLGHGMIRASSVAPSAMSSDISI